MAAPFPASPAGHSKAQEADTLAVGLMLHRMKPGTTAFPSIALLGKDGYDVRVASNGQYMYWWNGVDLVALEVTDITRYLKCVVHKGASKPVVSKPVVRHVVSKRR